MDDANEALALEKWHKAAAYLVTAGLYSIFLNKYQLVQSISYKEKIHKQTYKSLMYLYNAKSKEMLKTKQRPT